MMNSGYNNVELDIDNDELNSDNDELNSDNDDNWMKYCMMPRIIL